MMPWERSVSVDTSLVDAAAANSKPRGYRISAASLALRHSWRHEQVQCNATMSVQGHAV